MDIMNEKEHRKEQQRKLEKACYAITKRAAYDPQGVLAYAGGKLPVEVKLCKLMELLADAAQAAARSNEPQYKAAILNLATFAVLEYSAYLTPDDLDGGIVSRLKTLLPGSKGSGKMGNITLLPANNER